jgi:SLT domain-containing protein
VLCLAVQTSASSSSWHRLRTSFIAQVQLEPPNQMVIFQSYEQTEHLMRLSASLFAKQIIKNRYMFSSSQRFPSLAVITISACAAQSDHRSHTVTQHTSSISYCNRRHLTINSHDSNWQCSEVVLLAACSSLLS